MHKTALRNTTHKTALHNTTHKSALHNTIHKTTLHNTKHKTALHNTMHKTALHNTMHKTALHNTIHKPALHNTIHKTALHNTMHNTALHNTTHKTALHNTIHKTALPNIIHKIINGFLCLKKGIINSKYVIVSHTEFQPIVRKFHWITWKTYINIVCYIYDKIQLKFRKSLRPVVSKLKSTKTFSADNVLHTDRWTWPAITAFLLTFKKKKKKKKPGPFIPPWHLCGCVYVTK
jgi:ribosomal protein S20